MTKANWTRARRGLALALLLLTGGACDSGSSSTDGVEPDGGDAAGSGGSGPVAMAGRGAAGSSAAGSSAAGSSAAGSTAAGHGMAGDDGAGTSGDAGSDSVADAGSHGAGLTFEADIYPLLVGSCGNCHGAGSGGPPRPGGPGEGGSNAPGKFAVDDEAASYTAAMPYVVAGDSAKSALFIKVSEDMPSTGGARMPPALRQWDDASIAAVRDWIDQGAVER